MSKPLKYRKKPVVIEAMSTDSAHEALENLRLWLEDNRENHPRFAAETALFLLMLARFKSDYYPGEEHGREAP